MAVELMGTCWLAEIPATMKLVLMKIADCAEPDGSSIFPSVATIQEETGLGASTVRGALAAFEQSGLLDVREVGVGNRRGRTTVVRELDTDLLRLIAGRRGRRGQRPEPSTHILTPRECDVPAGATAVPFDGAVVPVSIEPQPKHRRMTVWGIVPRPAPEPDDVRPPAPGNDATPPGGGGAPLQQLEGYPSRSWSPPLQELEGSPPGAGGAYIDPSIDPSDDPLPQTPGGREREGGSNAWLLEAVRADGVHPHVVDRVIARLVTLEVGRLPDPPATLRAIRDALAEEADEVLDETARLLLHGRRAMPSVSQALDTCKQARQTHLPMIVIRKAEDPAAWAAWLAYDRSKGVRTSFIESRGERIESRRFPPVGQGSRLAATAGPAEGASARQAPVVGPGNGTAAGGAPAARGVATGRTR